MRLARMAVSMVPDSRLSTHGQDGSKVTAVANEGYHFTAWSDGLKTPTRTDRVVTADLECDGELRSQPVHPDLQGRRARHN